MHRALGLTDDDWQRVGPRVETALEEAQALGVDDPAALLPSILERLPSPCTAEALEAVSLTELLLAAACGARQPRALEHFDARYLRPVVQQVARRHPHLEATDLAQLVRERLLVGDGVKRLLAWRGHGSLLGWLRSVATRVALNARPTHAPQSLDDAQWEGVVKRLTTHESPELALLQRDRQEQVQTALRDALRRLPQREKLVLRLHVFEELSTEQLGRMFRVNPATARRWIQGARETVLDSVRAALQGSARWSLSQVNSALQGLGSMRELGLSALGPPEK